MALTFTSQKEGVAGDLRYWSGTILFDSSYPTGGEAITAANFGFGSTIFMLSLNPNGGVIPEFDRTNLKILVRFSGGGAGTSPTTLANQSVTLASGSTTVTSTSANPAITMTPGIGVEVGSTANLSTVTFQVFALGQ